jgi:methionyl-tRNA formyltransferase
MHHNDHQKLNIAYFGTPRFAVTVLDELKKKDIVPNLIVTTPDAPKGRGMVLTPPETKVWAEIHNIPCFQPGSLRDPATYEKLNNQSWDLFIVASYGKIIPKNVLDLPKYKTINVHPSLLPTLRGPSPIESAILQEEKTGVTIIVLDEEMDHGPIIAIKETEIYWPPRFLDLEHQLAIEGANLLAASLSGYIDGTIIPHEQDHVRATFCRKIKKGDALLNLSDEPEINLRKIRAYEEWPRAYFFIEKDGKQTRVIVTDAEIEDNKLAIKKVIPEGKKEIDYEIFLRGMKKL